MPENLHIDEETPQMKTPESEAIGELRRIVEEQKAISKIHSVDELLHSGETWTIE